MAYVMFYQYFPEIAERETRGIKISDKSGTNLPAGDYGFLEMFCDEPGCDCRRVLLSVVSDRTRDIEAVITYGWENRQFYVDWLKDDDPDAIKELQGPALNTSSPQSRLAPALLGLAQEMLFQDEGYIDRIKRHYHMFRDNIDKSGGRRPGESKRRKP
ncbi:MAG: hypothetical protein ABSD38_20295 [Syntrophorhabdales bacterium]|jgi:hypothetical protein